MLKDKIKSIEKQMVAQLEEIRATHIHKGNKGGEVEKILREFLKKYLPRRLDISHGEVIDQNSNRSAQTDVVVVSEEHPFTFSEDSPGLFFIEGVSAVGEVKSILTSNELANTIEKAKKYKQLRVIPPAGVTRYANPSDGNRYYVHPPFFLFSMESQIYLSKVFEKVKELTLKDYTPGSSIDGIFILNKGLVIDLGDGMESFKILNPESKVPYEGWKQQDSDNVIFDFLVWLSIVMPRLMGGAPILIPYMIDVLHKTK